jgi:hypothetical protein
LLHQRLPWLGLYAVEDRVQQAGLADELAATVEGSTFASSATASRVTAS